jgi:succinate-semialdehyde dehydrogenase/glutarate-semialdehyde dehydrogenase
MREAVFSHIEERLREWYGSLSAGDGFSAGAKQGPLVSRQADRIDALVHDAMDQGARVLCGGARLSLGPTFGIGREGGQEGLMEFVDLRHIGLKP